jgi:sigma-B regulation protein RsbU (phosphoserine phosphatase)
MFPGPTLTGDLNEMGKHEQGLGAATLERILQVTRKLAAPFELQEMLGQVVDAGIAVLSADRGSVFLYEEQTDELVGYVTTGMEALRIPADKGIAGECARTREVVNVPDCYSDPRFNPEVDRKTRYRTRCLLAVPLVGHDDSLVGVLQLLNKRDGTFGEEDERIAEALAAQCAVALQRVRMTEELLVKEKIQRELAVAREVQMGFLPSRMPEMAGYDLAGTSVPADETGGDTYDVVAVDTDRVALLLGDATGHGIGPALSATQVRAMLRIALRLGAGVDDIVANINDQLEQDLASNRFVTAFLGTLETEAHRVTYQSAGQAPLMHFHAAKGEFEWLASTTLPLGLLAPLALKSAATIDLAPGDILGLITDGVFECEDADGQQFGEDGVEQLVREHQARPMAELAELLFETVTRHGGDAPQADDITIVLVRRLPD